jgi:NAD-dependent dihydropyrimidine dehydrogenase PreA subunit
VKACPVDCIDGPLNLAELERLSKAERQQRVEKVQLFINPNVCICCGACQPECPVDAIFPDYDMPQHLQHYIELNARFFETK